MIAKRPIIVLSQTRGFWSHSIGRFCDDSVTGVNPWIRSRKTAALKQGPDAKGAREGFTRGLRFLWDPHAGCLIAGKEGEPHSRFPFGRLGKIHEGASASIFLETRSEIARVVSRRGLGKGVHLAKKLGIDLRFNLFPVGLLNLGSQREDGMPTATGHGL